MTPQEAAAAASSADALALELGLVELPSIARLARHLVTTFETAALDDTTAVHIASTSDDIRTLFSSAVAQHEAATSQRGVVLVAGDGSAEFDAMCWVLATRGFGIRSGDGDLAGDPAPVGAVIAANKGPDAGVRSLLRAVAESWPIPVIVLSQTSNAVELRELAQYSTTLLPLTTVPATVADELIRAVAARQVRPTALLCGTDDATAERLVAHDFEILPVASPDDLVRMRPTDDSVVVFGRGVADGVVATLARLIRATPATRRTPIVWAVDPAIRHHAHYAAREGVQTVDRVDDAVISHVRAQLRHAAFDHADEQSEMGTMLSWAAAQVLIDRSLVAAHRSGTSVAFASIDIGAETSSDALPGFVESFAREFRRGDVVCQRSDRNLVVALQGVSRRVATNRMTQLFERFAMDEGSSRVGVSVFPNDGRSATELAVAADAAQSLARSHDGPAVVSTTWRPEGDRAADVLVVDPDPVLATVLTTALEERGVRADAATDGRDALARLTGEGEQRLPRLILLDLDTPGMDGMSLIRRLGSAGVMSQTRVLLMAARSTESDVRLALELGVADIIRKPFSTTLLLHRAARLLEDAR